ncbi:DUF1579 domain-containing protein [Chitinophaga rhizophila]|uniref:DUF1579 domain-containing protein n=1 Tax=Chitinophaga rhizophila TaxID=2866212 RepID=A0ABS7G985_9BACT|nr:DUF1579 domain-containing protein [Chitinophaga rhizophila]MBW8684214.1 DUF1579 domain-containing protein [Chitinophaga rhizophila]
MRRLLLFSASAIVFFLLFNTAGKAQSAEEKAWMDYMSPGQIHQMIAKSDGEWDFDMTMWMAADQPPTKSTGTTVNKMILGGRYQESIHKGTMMGMPFEGHGVLAYDNGKKIFVNSWIDNMGTGIMTTEGTWDDATKSITFTGKAYDPMTGKDMPVREIFKLLDDDHHQMEMYMTHDGKEFKAMEIKFNRKK